MSLYTLCAHIYWVLFFGGVGVLCVWVTETERWVGGWKEWKRVNKACKCDNRLTIVKILHILSYFTPTARMEKLWYKILWTIPKYKLCSSAFCDDILCFCLWFWMSVLWKPWTIKQCMCTSVLCKSTFIQS